MSCFEFQLLEYFKSKKQKSMKKAPCWPWQYVQPLAGIANLSCLSADIIVLIHKDLRRLEADRDIVLHHGGSKPQRCHWFGAKKFATTVILTSNRQENNVRFLEQLGRQWLQCSLGIFVYFCYIDLSFKNNKTLLTFVLLSWTSLSLDPPQVPREARWSYNGAAVGASSVSMSTPRCLLRLCTSSSWVALQQLPGRSWRLSCGTPCCSSLSCWTSKSRGDPGSDATIGHKERTLPVGNCQFLFFKHVKISRVCLGTLKEDVGWKDSERICFFANWKMLMLHTEGLENDSVERVALKKFLKTKMWSFGRNLWRTCRSGLAASWHRSFRFGDLIRSPTFEQWTFSNQLRKQ